MKPVRSSNIRDGLPVNAVTGALMLAGDEDLDFVIRGALQLPWQRTYCSTHEHAGWFGRGWSSPLEVALEAVTDREGRRVESIEHIGVTGRRVRFKPIAPGGDAHAPGDQMRLSRTADGDYRLTMADGLTYGFAADDSGGTRLRLVSVADRNDNAIHLSYHDDVQGNGRVVVTCGGGRRLVLRFASHRLVQIDALRGESASPAALVRYTYSRHGDLTGVVNGADLQKRRFAYDSHRMLSWQRYAEVFESWTEYSSQGEAAKAVMHRDNVDRQWTLGYHDDRTEVTDVDGRVSIYHIDARRRWIGYTDPLGQFTARGLDASGNVRTVVNPAQGVDETVYDERSNPIEVHDAAGAVTTIEWHPEFTLPVAVTDALGGATRYDYDARGNLVAETNALGVRTEYEYDSRGLVIAVVDGRGGRSTLQYDDNAEAVEHTDCSGRKTRFAHDADGLLVRIENALGELTTYSYDAAGRLVRQVLADGSFESYELDLAGQLRAVVDATGARTEYHFAADGLLERRDDALGHHVSYRYDSARRLAVLVNENGASYRFGYDPADQLVDETRFDGTRARYTYDRAGFLVHSVEAPDTAQPIATTYRRDALGRLQSRFTADTNVEFAYDALGNIVQARSDPDGTTVQLQYDEVQRLVKEVQSTGTHAHVTTHSYDEIGTRIATVLPDGMRLDHLHYGSGHLHQVSLNGIPVTDIERDALHREVSRTQGRLSTSRLYDAAGRLTAQTSVASIGRGAGDLPAPGGVPLISRSFAYDATGRLVQARDRGKTRLWEYDRIDRLTRFDDERFAFDPAHNLLDRPQAVSGSSGRVEDNRVRVYEDKRFEYDAHGRVVEKRIGAHTVMRFDWDGEHRLKAATVRDARSERTTRYAYDAFARRTSKRSAGGETRFIWDGDHLLQSCSERAATTFIYEPGSHVPMAQSVRSPDAPAGPSAHYYYHCDPSGLPQVLTDGDGQLAWDGRYAAWGRLLEAIQAPEVVLDQPLRLQGQYCDDETGWHYNRYRYYDPDIGRFATPDPLGIAGGVSPFLYGPNPVAWIDPLGLARSPAQCAADKALADGKDSGAACQLEIGKDVVITDVSGNPGKLMPKLRRILERIPMALRDLRWHGRCAEIGCINQAMKRGLDLTGAKSSAVNIGAKKEGQQHGKPKPTCSTCRAVLKALDMTDGGPQ